MRPGESFVGQPIRSLQTMLRVISKTGTNIPLIIPDGIYGPTTMQAVSTYQRLIGLPATGITDQATWERIVLDYDDSIIRTGKATPIEILLEPNQILRKNESSPYIYLVQGMLAQLSGDCSQMEPPELTGILDTSTERAIISFQVLTALPETGEIDRKTWKYLVHMFTLSAHNYYAQE